MTHCIVVGDGDVAKFVERLATTEQPIIVRTLDINSDNGQQILGVPALVKFALENSVTSVSFLGILNRWCSDGETASMLLRPKSGSPANASGNALGELILDELRKIDVPVVPVTHALPGLAPPGQNVSKFPPGLTSTVFDKAIQFFHDWDQDQWATACIQTVSANILGSVIYEKTPALIHRYHSMPVKPAEATFLCRYSRWRTLALRMPTLGTNTVNQCASAGLAGILTRRSQAIVYDRDETHRLAQELNIHIEYFDD